MTLLSIRVEKYSHCDPDRDGYCLQIDLFGLTLFIGLAA